MLELCACPAGHTVQLLDRLADGTAAAGAAGGGGQHDAGGGSVLVANCLSRPQVTGPFAV